MRKTAMDAVVDADINHVVRQVSESSSLRREDANGYVMGGLSGGGIHDVLRHGRATHGRCPIFVTSPCRDKRIDFSL